jgi:hypothetical protein
MHVMRLRPIFFASASWAILTAAFAESIRNVSCEPWSFFLLMSGTMNRAGPCHHGKSTQKIEMIDTGMSQNFRDFNDIISNATTEFSIAVRYPGIDPLNFLSRFAMMA